MAVAMASPLYTSTMKEKLYSCDDNGAHTFWERWWADIEGEYPGESATSGDQISSYLIRETTNQISVFSSLL